MPSSTDAAAGATESALLDKIQELSFLRELNDRMGAAPDFATACGTLVGLVWEERPVLAVAYVSLDVESRVARLEAAQPPAAEPVPGEVSLDAAPMPALLASAEPVVSVETSRLPWFPADGRAVLLAAPTRLRGAVTGLLLVAVDPDAAVVEEERRLLAIAATSAALALDVAHREARAEFLAMLRHDVSNPVHAALGGTEIITDRLHALGDPELLRVAASVVSSLETVADLIASCLDMAAVERGVPGLRVAAVDLGALADEIVARLRPAAAERGQTIVGPRGTARVRGDRRQLGRVIANLIGNASKYTPAGGRITVEVTSAATTGTLVVQDTGYGIPVSDLPRVFTKHARFHAGRGIPGSGLGLYLSKAIIDAHGGRISVASTPGRGSTFTVTLPTDGAAARVS
jgi:signal transduction histidine kinase